MHKIGMPPRSTTSLSEARWELSSLQSGPDYCDSRNSRYRWDLRLTSYQQPRSSVMMSAYMDLNLPIPLAELLLLLRTDILIPKEDYTSLRNQQP